MVHGPATVLTFITSVTTRSAILRFFHHIAVIIKWLSVSPDKINYRSIPTPPRHHTTTINITLIADHNHHHHTTTAAAITTN
jgi:hypothetical protein